MRTDGPRLEFANDPVNRKHNKKHGYYGRPLMDLAEGFKEESKVVAQTLNETSDIITGMR